MRPYGMNGLFSCHLYSMTFRQMHQHRAIDWRPNCKWTCSALLWSWLDILKSEQPMPLATRYAGRKTLISPTERQVKPHFTKQVVLRTSDKEDQAPARQVNRSVGPADGIAEFCCSFHCSGQCLRTCQFGLRCISHMLQKPIYMLRYLDENWLNWKHTRGR